MRLLSIDVETTSLDLETASIVELAIVQSLPDGSAVTVWEGFFKPGEPISPEATAVHGITNEQVEDCPYFLAHAQEIQEALFGAMILGFGNRRFDVPILDRELRNADQSGIDFDLVREIDLYRCWFELESRNLEGAVRRFAPFFEHEAHGALSDAQANIAVLAGMREEFDLTLEQMEALTKPSDEVDRFGKFKRLENGDIVFNFGKHKGKKAMDEKGYLQWMISNKASFHPTVKEMIRKALFEQQEAF